MRNPIIVGVALRDDDDAPLALAHTLARLTGAPLALVTSYAFGTAPPYMASEWLAAVHRQAGLALAPIAATCAEDLDVSTHVRPGTSAARALYEVAIELEARAIVVGSSRRGRVGRVLAGSVTTDLLRDAPCPVVVTPRDYVQPADGFRRIGVGFIDTPEGHAALSVACEMARAGDGSVAVFNVMEPIEWSPALLIDGWTVDRVFHAEREERVRTTSASAQRVVAEPLLSSVQVPAGDPATILAGTSARSGPPGLRIARIRPSALRDPRQRVTRTGTLGRVPSPRRPAVVSRGHPAGTAAMLRSFAVAVPST